LAVILVEERVAIDCFSMAHKDKAHRHFLSQPASDRVQAKGGPRRGEHRRGPLPALMGAGDNSFGEIYFCFAARPMNQPAAIPTQHAPAMNLAGWLRT
jgi:hypothetical protein